MTSLLLVRHGQIKANLQGLWHGSTDSPLTWRGRRQASRTARYIDRLDPGVTAIYTSPLGRCVETAGKIGKRLKIDPVVCDNLREYAIGEWPASHAPAEPPPCIVVPAMSMVPNARLKRDARQATSRAVSVTFV